jgi:hypothetical protein
MSCWRYQCVLNITEAVIEVGDKNQNGIEEKINVRITKEISAYKLREG